MEDNTKQPTVIIECTNGAVIKIYQQLTDAYIRELLTEFSKDD